MIIEALPAPNPISEPESGNGDEATLEFRSYGDDAWYSVRVWAEGDSGDGEHLRVRYCGFPDAHDNVFRRDDFGELKKLDDFAARFRPISLQLQDSECSRAPTGLLVCASHYFRDDDVRFYDALVEAVDRAEHSFVKGEEECSCTFTLSWLHGPNVGNYTAENIGQICRVQFNEEIDPTVASFIRAAREKIHMASYISNLSPKFEVGKGFTPNVHGEIPKMKIGHKLSFSHHLKQGTRCTNWSLSDSMLSKWIIGYPCERIGQDTDFGGVDDYYLIVVENLEKDLTPLAMMEFISKEAKVLSQAFILPSLSSDYVTRGNILLDSRRNFERLCDFLENPDQVVVSSNGRPWVITEKMSVRDALLVSIETFALISQILGKTKNIGSGSGLKVVRRGTVEYTIAKKLSNLYKEFSNHQKKLQKRLIVDEGKIWQEYNAERRVRS
ncbi:uncharacterized protein LOC21388354 isoform X2 [Morus notabilis]|uniref:uncharacterized protein LOC21388354 isoform X2 n=1 Tax=Morus notabilis TaxID=981085 RepID=UPI000CED79D6|nr:uncharacterized protein LOC21388354 isoform X2 [Morus notabilis]